MKRRGQHVFGETRRYEWPQEAREMLVSMWTEDYPASRISAALEAAGHNFSRNAVIGKAHRLNLPLHVRQATPRAAVPRKVRPYKTSEALRERERLRMQAKRAVTPLKPVAPTPPEPWTGPSISILDDKLSRFMCREIVAGRGPDTMFCGAPTVPGSQFSYCGFHAVKNLRLVQRKTAKPGFVPCRAAG